MPASQVVDLDKDKLSNYGPGCATVGGDYFKA